VTRIAERGRRVGGRAISSTRSWLHGIPGGAEQRAVAVLVEVVIGGVDLEAAQVGDERAGVHGVVAGEAKKDAELLVGLPDACLRPVWSGLAPSFLV